MAILTLIWSCYLSIFCILLLQNPNCTRSILRNSPHYFLEQPFSYSLQSAIPQLLSSSATVSSHISLQYKRIGLTQDWYILPGCFKDNASCKLRPHLSLWTSSRHYLFLHGLLQMLTTIVQSSCTLFVILWL